MGACTVDQHTQVSNTQHMQILWKKITILLKCLDKVSLSIMLEQDTCSDHNDDEEAGMLYMTEVAKKESGLQT
jgi:hypothetical protein